MKKLCIVYWYDAHSKDDWIPATEEPIVYEPFLVATVGWLTEFEDGLVVTPSKADNQKDFPNNRFGDVHIPLGCVKEIKCLK